MAAVAMELEQEAEAGAEQNISEERRMQMDEFDRQLNRSRGEDETLELAIASFGEMFDIQTAAVGVPHYADDSKLVMHTWSRTGEGIESAVGSVEIRAEKTIDMPLVTPDLKLILPPEGLEFVFSNGSGIVLEMSSYEDQRLTSYIVAASTRGIGTGLAGFSQRDIEIFQRYAEKVAAKLTDQHKMVTDGLTGLCTKQYGAARLKHEYQRALREDTSIAVMMIDLDHFKLVNDAAGHPYGDKVLRAAGSLVRSNIRSYDIPVRDGGEEIMIILPKTQLSVAVRRAEELRALFEENIQRHDGAPQTVSIGVAAMPYVQEAGRLREHADQAMYCAKNRMGRNHVCYSDGTSIIYREGKVIAPAPATMLRVVKTA